MMVRQILLALILSTPAMAAGRMPRKPISGRFSMFIKAYDMNQEQYEQLCRERIEQLRIISPHRPDRRGNYRPIPDSMKANRSMFTVVR